MKEQEAWGLINKTLFIKYNSIFTKKYGKPLLHKRLAISFWNPKIRKNTDTRIRITDRKPQVMQKTGRWENIDQWVFTETLLDLPADADQVFAAFNILKNIVGKKNSIRFIQHKSYIFETGKYEIKLAEQYGKKTKYIFEVELKKDGLKLKDILSDLELSDYTLKTDTVFWDKWNKEVNMTSEDLKDAEILELIKSYL